MKEWIDELGKNDLEYRKHELEMMRFLGRTRWMDREHLNVLRKDREEWWGSLIKWQLDNYEYIKRVK